MTKRLRQRVGHGDQGFTLIEPATNGGYCLENTTRGTVTYHKSGPSGDIKSGSC